MKRFILSFSLFVLGFLGAIEMVAATVGSNVIGSEGFINGWWDILRWRGLQWSFVALCLMSVAGLALCVLDLLREKK